MLTYKILLGVLKKSEKMHYIERSSDLFVLVLLYTRTRIYFIKMGSSRKKYVQTLNNCQNIFVLLTHIFFIWLELMR